MFHKLSFCNSVFLGVDGEFSSSLRTRQLINMRVIKNFQLLCGGGDGAGLIP